jgi:tetratricopeptide (TPR) repeat protein
VAAALAIFSFALLPLTGRYYLFVMTPARFGWGVTPSFYPRGLPRFLKRIRFRGNVYTSAGLGGFLEYYCYPRLRPINDTRWEIYDQKVLQEIKAAPENARIWQDLVRTYDIRGVLLENASAEAHALVPRLQTDQLWRLVYYDYGASFWMRTDQSGLPPQLNLAAVRSSLPLSNRVDDYLILNSFYQGMGDWDLLIKDYQRIYSLGYKKEQALMSIAGIDSLLSRLEDEEETYTTVIASYPDNEIALRELAYLAYGRGDISAARSYLRRAKALAPRDRRVIALENTIGG